MEKGQVIEHETGEADIIWYTESPSGYPRPHVCHLTKKGYIEYKKAKEKEEREKIAVKKKESFLKDLIYGCQRSR